MATSRETIEIALSGLNRITDLQNRLEGLQRVANSVAGSISRIGDEIGGLEGSARAIASGNRVLRRTRALARATAENPATGAGLPQGDRSAMRQRMRQMGSVIDAQLAERRLDLRDILTERRFRRARLSRLEREQQSLDRIRAREAEERQRTIAALRTQREDILSGARETGARARRRGTDTLIERRRAQAQRLRSGPDLLPNLVPVANEIDRRLEFTENRLRELNRASRALARTVRAANPEAEPREIRGIVERERRTLDSQRRAIATEQGRLIEQRKELNRNDAGRRTQFDQRRRLNERMDVLQRAAGLGLASRSARLPESTRADVRARFAQASDLAAAGNLEGAKAIYAVIEKTVSAKERQLRLDQQITRENEKASAAGVSRERQRQTAITQERRNLRSIEAQQRNLAKLAGQGAAGLPSFQRFQAVTQRLPQLQQAGDYDEFARTLVDAATYGRFTRDELKTRNQITKRTNKYEGEINKIAADILAGKKVERSQVDRLLKFNELRAGGVPQQLALPPAAPGSAAFTAAPEVVNARLGLRGTESVIGGVAQPRMIERLGGTRTSEDALKALPEKAKAAGTKSGQQAGQTFAKAFAKATPLGVSDKLLSEVSGFFKKLPTTLGKSLSAGGGTQSSQVAQTFQKAFAEATDFETPGSLLVDLGKVFGKLPSIIGNAAKANKNYEEGLKKTATAVEQLAVKTEILENLNAGVYDDSDLEKLVNNLYESERAASAYLEKLSSTYKLEDERRKANERGASKSEQRLDRENSQMLAIEKRQRKLAELQAAGVTGPAIQRAQSLVERLPDLAARGAGGAKEFARVDKQAAQALGFAAPGRGAGAGGGKAKTPEQIARNFARELSSAQVAEQNLIGLSRKNVDASSQLASIQGAINQAKSLGTSISEKDLEILKDQVATARDFVKVQNAQLANAQKGSNLKALKAASESRLPSLQRDTLTSGLIELSRADTAAKVFRGGRSGEQALSDAISALKAATGTQPRSTLLAPGSTGGLRATTQKGVPIGAGAAAEAVEDASATLIDQGEAEVRTAIQRLFDRLSGAMNQVFGGGGGGGRPPGGPVPPNGPDPGDFEGRIEGARGNAQRLLGLADMADLSQASNKQLQLFSAALAEVRDGLKTTDAAFNKLNKVIDRTDDALARRDPEADLLVRGFGRRGGQAVGEGLIGGAFPLLFGQGGGAALGGGLGGALGGFAGGTLGFGLSLAGTAIGSQVDAVIQAAQDTGNMLRDLTGNFEQIKNSGLLASREQEKLAAALLEAGNKAAAYVVIQSELVSKLGVDGVAKLKGAADAGDRMNRAMAELGTQLQIFVAGPLTNFLNAISSVIERQNLENRVTAGLQQAEPGVRASVEKDLAAARGQAPKSPLAALTDAIAPFGTPGLPGGPLSVIKAISSLFQGSDVSTTPTPVLTSAVQKLRAGARPRPLSPAEQRQATIAGAESNLAGVQRELEAFSKRNEGRDLIKGLRQQTTAAKREQEDLDRQSFELRRDYERQIEDIRRGVEDRISQLRQENAQKELEILVKQGQIREQQFKNSAAALQGALAGDPLAQGLADAVTTYLGAQMSAQDQIEQRRKQFEIEITNQQVEADKYKLEVARTLSRLNTDTAEKVAEINRGVRRRNEDAALNEFNLQKESAKLRAEIVLNELLVLKAKQADYLALAQGRQSQNPLFSPELAKVTQIEQQRLDNYSTAVDEARKNIEVIGGIKAPPLLREVAGPATRSVSLAGVNQQIAKGSQLLNQLKESEEQLAGLIKSGNLQQFTNDISLLATQGFDQLAASLKSSRDQLDLAGGDFRRIFDNITASYQNFISEFPKQNKGEPLSQELVDYLATVTAAQIELQKLVPTIEFYQSGFSDMSSQIDQAKTSLEELLLPTKAYDRVLAQINSRGGLGINPEDEERLLRNARALDELNARLKALNALNDIASSWTDSFVQLNKELLKGGSLLESVQRFAESVADRTLDVILEFTLRPIQEKLFKGMADMLGIDQAPENPLLLPVKQIEDHVRNLLNQAKKPFADKTGVVLPQQVAPANAIVPGPNAAQRQGYPEYIDKSVLRNWLMSQGMGRTSGDFTNAGHRTPNHMLNAMDMGFIDPKYDNNYVQKTKEMEARLRATGAFGDQLFGPTSDPKGHGTHLHVPTPGGRVKVTPGLAELLKLGQPTQSPAMNSGFQVPGSPLDGKPAPAPGSTILRKLIPAAQPPSGRAIPLQVIPPVETQQQSPVAPAADQAAESIGNLDQKAREAADGVQEFGGKMSESVTKFQTIVGTGLQAITSVAMGIGGAQMIRKGGAYNTLMGAASIFGSIGSITGMFGTGGSLSGLFGKRAAPGGARALGGPVYEGMDYIVGEQGPEVIRMGANGTVVPADELYVPGLDDDGSSAPPIGRYSRRAASSMESTDMEDGDTIYTGNYGRAVPYQRSESTREIERLERVISNPGELPPIKYETARVNEYDFVTPEQLEASNSRTAKMARNQTIRELADSMKTRKRLGL